MAFLVVGTALLTRCITLYPSFIIEQAWTLPPYRILCSRLHQGAQGVCATTVFILGSVPWSSYVRVRGESLETNGLK